MNWTIINACEEDIDKAIYEAENEYKENGVLLDAKDAITQLKNKHFNR